MRIKRLYAYNNNIVTLDGSLGTFTFLDTLVIYNNNLADLHAQLEILGQMRHLEELDMHGNPLAEETNYRLHVIKNLPWLHVLDRHIITPEERALAATVKTAAELADEGEKPKKTKVKMKPSEKQVRSYIARLVNLDVPLLLLLTLTLQLQAQAQLNSALDLIRDVVKNKRVLLKDHFIHDDPRSEWVLPEDAFTKYMSLYSLDLLAKNVRGPFDAYELLINKYKATVPVRSKTMGRDNRVTMGRARFVDYMKFCMDVEPKFNSRDMDNTQRLAAKARDLRLGPDLEDKVPLSQTVKNLRDSVSKYKRGICEKAQEERMRMVKLSEDALRAQRQMRVPMAKSEADFVVPRDRLDAWEMTELRDMAIDRESYDKKTGEVAVKDLRGCLEDMILCGRISVTTDLEEFVEAERKAKLALAEFEDADPEDDGKEDEKVNPISRFLEELPKGKSGAVKLTDFLSSVEHGCDEVPPMTWRFSTIAESKAKSKALYAEAATLTHRVALMGDSDEAMRLRNTARIKYLTKWAQKLEKMATHELAHKYNRSLGPRLAVRADTYVIKDQREIRELAEDEGLSDDEEEAKTEDDTEEMWKTQVDGRRKLKDRTEKVRESVRRLSEKDACAAKNTTYNVLTSQTSPPSSVVAAQGQVQPLGGHAGEVQGASAHSSAEELQEGRAPPGHNKGRVRERHAALQLFPREHALK